MNIKCLIVDDELTSRQGLEFLCGKFPYLHIVGTCHDGVEAIDGIRAHAPDLVFLDIHMPKVTGLEVLASLPPPLPQIIFITAHDQYAIKAFELNAVDYLLKPFSDERFEAAIDRAVERIRLKKQQQLTALLKDNPKQQPDVRDSNETRLVIKNEGAIHMIDKEQIEWVEAYDYYVKIHVAKRFFLLRDTMKNMERHLANIDCMRVHNSAIVRKTSVRSMTKLPSGEHALSLTTNHTVKVSRSKVAAVKKWLT